MLETIETCGCIVRVCGTIHGHALFYFTKCVEDE